MLMFSIVCKRLTPNEKQKVIKIITTTKTTTKTKLYPACTFTNATTHLSSGNKTIKILDNLH